MSEWISCTFDDVLELQRGFDLPIQKRTMGNYPIIAANGIIDYHSEYKVIGPGVVTGRSGTIGEVFLIKNNFWPLNTTLWVKDFKDNDVRFIYYFLKNLDFNNLNFGTSVPTLNRNDLRSIETSIPPLPEQKIIASVLGNIDDKIELNRRMNKTLKAMAMTLYRHYFIDFGLPPNVKYEADECPFGNLVDTDEMGPVPVGWEIAELKEFTTKIQYGYTTSASLKQIGPKFLRITDIQGGDVNWRNVPYCKIDPINYEKYKINAGDIFIARTGASTGENIYIPTSIDAVFASYLVRLQFDSLYKARYFGQLLRTTQYSNFINSIKGGSAQPNASAQLLTEIKVILPPDTILKKYYDEIFQYDKLRMINSNEIETLSRTRDFVLPQLLSGEVRVQ